MAIAPGGGYLGICIALFVWDTSTLYMYYNSVKHGVVGCLLAALLQRGDEDNEGAYEEGDAVSDAFHYRRRVLEARVHPAGMSGVRVLPYG